ncbi:MAG TPA: hypothetical protein VK149_04375 [Sideroxyarcus sp.]|nr:hypothetical protein [Sideroxyarcus sp.]
MAQTGVAPADWAQRVLAARTQDELNALWTEAVMGDFGTRARYALINENQAALRRVDQVMQRTAMTAFKPLDRLSQQGAATLFRDTVPGLIDEFGNVNAQLAKNYYQTQRFNYYHDRFMAKADDGILLNRRASKNLARQATSRAQAQLDSALQLANGYQAKLPKFDALAKSDTIVNYAMRLFMSQGAGAAGEISNALTRAVASYNRDTILYNSALDKDVVAVQRVAEPNACDFCQMVAFDSYGSARTSSYAADYHSNCRCSVETLYKGDKPLVPDYYKDFPYGSNYADLEDAQFDASTSAIDELRKVFTADYVSK